MLCPANSVMLFSEDLLGKFSQCHNCLWTPVADAPCVGVHDHGGAGVSQRGFLLQLSDQYAMVRTSAL